MPDDTPGVAASDVIILSAEDDLADTIRPRLDAAAADVTRVHAIPLVSDWRPTIPTDIDVLASWISTEDAKLVIIDPLFAHLDGNINANSDPDMRQALAPLGALASETGAAIVLIRHLRKSGADNHLYRGGGSIAVIASARSGLLVGRDPEDADRRVLAVSKSNLAANPPSLGYGLTEDREHASVKVSWYGPVDVSAEHLLDVMPDEDQRTKQEEAESFLEAALADGPVPASVVVPAAKQVGISSRTLDRAKANLGIHPFRDGFGPGGRWVWALPGHSAPSGGIDRHVIDAAFNDGIWRSMTDEPSEA